MRWAGPCRPAPRRPKSTWRRCGRGWPSAPSCARCSAWTMPAPPPAPCSLQEVFDQCLVSFQAGHETTATALTWWSALLLAHPAAARRARAEVDAVLGGAPPGPGDMHRLPWLQATLKEALRLYPPTTALMTRRCTAPLRPGGHTLPARTMLRVTVWAIHRDPRWFPAPDTFRPERFLPDAPPPPRGAYLPFGLGPRACIGQHFAQLGNGHCRSDVPATRRPARPCRPSAARAGSQRDPAPGRRPARAAAPPGRRAGSRLLESAA